MNESKVGIVVQAYDRASKILKDVSANAETMGKKMKGVGKTMTAGLTLPILAMGTAIVKTSMDFEKSMTNISTLIDTNVESMEDMAEGVRQIARKTPVALADLTSALYDVRSAGIAAGDAMSVLEASAKLGVAGLGTTKEATTLMTLAVNNFRDSGLSASEVADIMFKTVKNGITTVGQLSQSFGLVAPLAQATGISLQELQAATAALTQVNKSASISQNSLKAALVSLSKPTAQAQELFEKLGVDTFAGLVEKTGGMVKAFGAMQDATDGNTQMFAKAIGSGEALTSVISLLGGQSESFTTSLADMNGKVNAIDEAYQKQLETFSALWQLLKNNFNVALLELGTELMPMIQKGAEWLTEKIEMLTDKWKKLEPETQKWILMSLGILALVGPLLLGLGFLASSLVSITGALTLLGGAFTIASTQGITMASGLNGLSFAGVLGSVALVALAFTGLIILLNETIKTYEALQRDINGLEGSLKTLESLEGTTQTRIDELKGKGEFERAEKLQKTLNKVSKDKNFVDVAGVSPTDFVFGGNEVGGAEGTTPQIINNFDFKGANVTDKIYFYERDRRCFFKESAII